jgi:hypothetical protein
MANINCPTRSCLTVNRLIGLRNLSPGSCEICTKTFRSIRWRAERACLRTILPGFQKCVRQCAGGVCGDPAHQRSKASPIRAEANSRDHRCFCWLCGCANIPARIRTQAWSEAAELSEELQRKFDSGSFHEWRSSPIPNRKNVWRTKST